ncbi:hypothetical protein ACIGG6_02060 [Vreelandella lionensis]|uniref:DUF4376 domain-containing protein n=1 Tax=Vreelandella lionensis TaxID=1144478 RepID=A0ABW8BQ62_9GAMM
MQIEILRNDRLIAGPIPWDASRVRDIIMRQGGDYRLVPNGFISPIHIGSISVLPVRSVKPELTVMQAYGQPERTASNDEVVYTYPVVERDYDEVLEEQRAKKLNEINNAYTTAAAPLIKEYPEVETKGWDQQKADAEAYLAWHETQQGEPPQMMVLDKILAGRNGEDGTETLYELSVAVQRNAAAFAEFQVLTGKRQRLAKLARAAETLEALEAIQW